MKKNNNNLSNGNNNNVKKSVINVATRKEWKEQANTEIKSLSHCIKIVKKYRPNGLTYEILTPSWLIGQLDGVAFGKNKNKYYCLEGVFVDTKKNKETGDLEYIEKTTFTPSWLIDQYSRALNMRPSVK